MWPAPPKRRRVDSGTEKEVVVRIGGVPEHFNYPFKMCVELGLYKKHGVNVEWKEMRCGTGAMISAVKKNEIDLCVALTEGLTADIAKGSDLRILGTYVQSPLCWAVSAGANSKINSIDDLRGKTFGISRYGSGSHLMAYVLAMQRGWDPQNDIKFKVIGAFENLRNSVNSGETDAFMWETFTTKPYHDSGEVRRVGDITTPWPCFMVAGLNSVVKSKALEIASALAAVNEAAMMFHGELKGKMPGYIAENYGLKPKDALKWYNGVHIAANRYVSEAALERALEVLCEAKVLDEKTTHYPADLINPTIAELRNDIEHMRLYRSNQPLGQLLQWRLKNLKKVKNGKISVEMTDLVPIDTNNIYEGKNAIDDAIKYCEIGKTSRVINIGSGLGGSARYMGWKTGCQVLACELQDGLHKTAQEVTSLAGLQNVIHMAGDFMQVASFLSPSSQAAIVSWLTVLHINDRRGLFKRCFSLLQPGGVFYAADFIARGQLTVPERQTLRRDVYCDYVPRLEAYKQDLEDVGFRIEKVEDKSDEWADFTAKRAKAWKSKRKEIVSGWTNGEKSHSEIAYFYDLIAKLYEGGNLGGAVIVARKPLGW